jgi:hypothetical protein
MTDGGRGRSHRADIAASLTPCRSPPESAGTCPVLSSRPAACPGWQSSHPGNRGRTSCPPRRQGFLASERSPLGHGPPCSGASCPLHAPCPRELCAVTWHPNPEGRAAVAQARYEAEARTQCVQALTSTTPGCSVTSLMTTSSASPLENHCKIRADGCPAAGPHGQSVVAGQAANAQTRAINQ